MTEIVPEGELQIAGPTFYPFGGPRRPVVADPTTLSRSLLHRLHHVHDLHGRCVKNRFDTPDGCQVTTPSYVVEQ